MFKLYFLISQHGGLRGVVQLPKLCTLQVAKLLFLGFFILSVSTPALAKNALHILTWSEYIDPAVVQEFESLHNVQIRFSYFESDQARDEAIASVDAQGYDLFLVNSFKVENYGTRGWLEPLDQNQIPNTKNIDEKWKSAFAGVETYAVPYFWGTLGVAYRKDLLPNGFDSWMDLLKPEEKLKGKILMIGDSRELTSIALKAAGLSPNTNNIEHLRQARKLLQHQRPYVEYAYPTMDENSVMLTGEVWAASMYNGDALALQEHSDNIAYVVPNEGTLLWVDYFTVAQKSDNKALAHQFLNFINRADIAARIAEWVYFASPNIAAKPFLSAEYFSNTTIHPESHELEKSEVIRSVAPRTTKYINSIGAELFRDVH